MIRMIKGMFRSLFGGRTTQGGQPMMSCEEALEALFEYLDGELDTMDTARIEKHLEICKACYPRAEFERSFLEALERARNAQTAPNHIQARVLAALEQESG